MPAARAEVRGDSLDRSHQLIRHGVAERSVSWRRTSSGMMLCLVPPWMEPTVTTAGVPGSSSRLTMVWSISTISEASTIGSLARWGLDPWPP